ncbi:hypothetical protein PUNSTDRAFT_127548 [Punctularia strigosozonata HHB-11173 SS5]|uniref:uncharacterized protein n=1 Tax=Punctularia strigosozonata (strain HHB-11173) TaxID=741275 RepID=UPI0004417730|nr:uncharacterized protein PUNSTDRAFT_127548 [Punctularia strigosozonata HHB-11173 SS5]EIN06146.1 hypothetical protein PUNSTDRAFT_127548 [Punctularia strigosozonata HHB-11173 SS5]
MDADALRDAMPPATNLPAELLVDIFTRLCSPLAGPPEPRPHNKAEFKSVMNWNPAVAQVCRYWRSVAMETPPLWNVLDLSKPKLALALSRRFTFQLYVTLVQGFEYVAWETFLMILHEAGSRIVNLTIPGVRSESDAEAIVEVLHGHALSLSQLNVDALSDSPEDTSLVPLYALHAPILTNLFLSNAPVSHWGSPIMRSSSLRKLAIHGAGTQTVNISAVVETCRQLTSLVTVDWQLSSLHDDLDLNSSVRVRMPNLHGVVLTGPASACATFLRYVVPREDAMVMAKCMPTQDMQCARFCQPLWNALTKNRYVESAPGPLNLRLFQLDGVLLLVLGLPKKTVHIKEFKSIVFFHSKPAEHLQIMHSLGSQFEHPAITSLTISTWIGLTCVMEWATFFGYFSQIHTLYLENPISAVVIFTALNVDVPGTRKRELLPNLKEIVIQDNLKDFVTEEAPELESNSSLWFDACRKFLETRRSEAERGDVKPLEALHVQNCYNFKTADLEILQSLVPVFLNGNPPFWVDGL